MYSNAIKLHIMYVCNYLFRDALDISLSTVLPVSDAGKHNKGSNDLLTRIDLGLITHQHGVGALRLHLLKDCTLHGFWYTNRRGLVVD